MAVRVSHSSEGGKRAGTVTNGPGVPISWKHSRTLPAILDFLDPSCFAEYPFVADKMNPELALQEQIERYRRMTGEQRLTIALNLHELSCNVAREGIRHQNPNADAAEVERMLRKRLELARQ